MQQLPFCGTLCGLNYIILINCSNNTYHIYFIIRRFRYSYSKARCTETMNRAFFLTIQTKLGILPELLYHSSQQLWLKTSIVDLLIFCWFIYFYLFIYLITKANAVSCDNVVSISHLIQCSCAAWHIFLVPVYSNHFL